MILLAGTSLRHCRSPSRNISESEATERLVNHLLVARFASKLAASAPQNFPHRLQGHAMKNDSVAEFPELSLMEGGPGDALMKRLRLICPLFGTASGRTALILAALTWLPLLVFSFIEGLALGGARIPFLYDLAAHARFLVAVPILVLAEIPIGKRLRGVAKHFLEAGLVREGQQKQFANCVIDTVRFHDWHLAEMTLLALAYITTYAAISKTSLQSGSTWLNLLQPRVFHRWVIITRLSPCPSFNS